MPKVSTVKTIEYTPSEFEEAMRGVFGDNATIYFVGASDLVEAVRVNISGDPKPGRSVEIEVTEIRQQSVTLAPTILQAGTPILELDPIQVEAGSTMRVTLPEPLFVNRG